MHVEVLTDQPSEPDLGQASYVSQDDPVQGTAVIQPAQPAQPFQPAQPAGPDQLPGGAPGMGGPDGLASPDEFPTQAPVVKRAEDKLGRNQPCWCGSGKKYKLCHGR
jgi:hypothetical protein